MGQEWTTLANSWLFWLPTLTTTLMNWCFFVKHILIQTFWVSLKILKGSTWSMCLVISFNFSSAFWVLVSLPLNETADGAMKLLLTMLRKLKYVTYTFHTLLLFIKFLLFPHDHFFVWTETAFQSTRRSNLNKCNADWIEGEKISDVNTNLVTVSNRVNIIYIINTLKQSCPVLSTCHRSILLLFLFFFVPTSCFLLFPQVEILSRMRLHKNICNLHEKM